MTIPLVLLTFLMAALLWWLFGQTINVQPWVARAATQDVRIGVLSHHPAKTALIVFLAVASSLFALFISAYAMRITFLDWTPLPQPKLLALNTGLLIAASVAMQWTVFAARRGDVDTVRTGLIAVGALTGGFIVGQLVVWKQLYDAGYALATSAATGFFYLLTAVHGVHVLGGLVAWGRSTGRAWKGKDLNNLVLSVELCAIYWHFLLGVWIVLFVLLVSNYIGLAICSTSP
jgi:cytochrome c oxidase subunit III